jgi:hypothetical protein
MRRLGLPWRTRARLGQHEEAGALGDRMSAGNGEQAQGQRREGARQAREEQGQDSGEGGTPVSGNQVLVRLGQGSDLPGFPGPLISGKMALPPKGRADAEESIHGRTDGRRAGRGAAARGCQARRPAAMPPASGHCGRQPKRHAAVGRQGALPASAACWMQLTAGRATTPPCPTKQRQNEHRIGEKRQRLRQRREAASDEDLQRSGSE